MHASSKINVVGRTTALLFGAQWLIFQLMLRNWDRTEVAARFFLGNDFAYLYSAAGHFLSGRSPYAEPGFIPLPSALYLPLLLHPLSFWSALFVFRTVSFVLAIAAVVWLCRELHLNALNTALMLVIVLTYGPFYMVLVGGNLDALMLALLVFGTARPVPLRGFFLGLSIGTKFYSVLLVPVLAIRRRWREILWVAGTLAVLLLPFAHYWPDAFSSILHRGSALRFDSNESPAVLFILLFGEKRVWAWAGCYVLLWGGTLLARVIADLRIATDIDSERFRVVDYLPWMAGAPALVFTYTGTILLPFMACLFRKNQERRLTWAEWMMAAGFILTGTYPIVARRVFAALPSLISMGQYRIDQILLLVAPLGVTAMLIGSSLAAWKVSGVVSTANEGASAVTIASPGLRSPS